MKPTLLLLITLLLAGYVLTDLLLPRRTDLRQFTPAEVARPDGEMLRSYYEKNRCYQKTVHTKRRPIYFIREAIEISLGLVLTA